MRNASQAGGFFMERIEYFSLEIKQKEIEKAAKIAVVRDPELWRETYERIACDAWKKNNADLISI